MQLCMPTDKRRKTLFITLIVARAPRSVRRSMIEHFLSTLFVAVLEQTWLYVHPFGSSHNTIQLVSTADCTYLLRPGRGAKYCDVRVCMFARLSVSLSVCPLAYLRKSKLQFLYILLGTVARSSSNDNGIRHPLPVWWMTSRFSHHWPYGVWYW